MKHSLTTKQELDRLIQQTTDRMKAPKRPVICGTPKLKRRRKNHDYVKIDLKMLLTEKRSTSKNQGQCKTKIFLMK